MTLIVLLTIIFTTSSITQKSILTNSSRQLLFCFKKIKTGDKTTVKASV